MRSNREIYLELVLAENLEAAVQLLDDHELRQVRGALSRGDYNEWPADRVHGVCIIEGCRRFEFPALTEEVPSGEGEVRSKESFGALPPADNTEKISEPLQNPSGGTPPARPAAGRTSHCDCCHGSEVGL